MRRLFVPLLMGVPAVVILQAANPYLGVVVAGGKVLLNHARTAGNATVFEGSSLETADFTCRVRLAAGGWAQLGIRSSGRLFTDRVELESGSVRLSNYSAAALGLKINAANDAVGTVLLEAGTVEVSAIAGALHVYNASGLNVANVLPGQTLNLEPLGIESSRATAAVSQSRAISADTAPLHARAPIVAATVNSGAGGVPVVTSATAGASSIAPVSAVTAHLSAAGSQAVVANALPAASPGHSAMTGGVRIYTASSAQGVLTTKARSDDDNCLSADRDCKHGHDPGDDGHGHGNDDHDHGHGHGHDH